MPRRVLFTLNNPTAIEMELLDRIKDHPQFRFMIVQGEFGEMGTPHLQGYLEISKNQAQSFFKNLLGVRCHIEYARGTSSDNIHYCSKPIKNEDGSRCQCDHCRDAPDQWFPPVRYGEPAKEKTTRNFWEETIQAIAAEKTDLQIITDLPQAAGMLRQIQELRTAINAAKKLDPTIRNPARDWRRLRVVWITGEPGVGKSYAVRSAYDQYYTVGTGKYPFDFYENERVILWDDFDPTEVKFKQLLNYLDIYPVQLAARYNNKWAAFSEVFITHAQRPEYAFAELSANELEQLIRRINVMEIEKREGQWKYIYRRIMYDTFQQALAQIPFREFVQPDISCDQPMQDRIDDILGVEHVSKDK